MGSMVCNRKLFKKAYSFSNGSVRPPSSDFGKEPLVHVTCSFEDDGLALHPAVAWKIIDGVLAFDFDRNAVYKPITVKATLVILQCHQQKFANVFGSNLILIFLSSFKVIVKPFVKA